MITDRYTGTEEDPDVTDSVAEGSVIYYKKRIRRYQEAAERALGKREFKESEIYAQLALVESNILRADWGKLFA